MPALRAFFGVGIWNRGRVIRDLVHRPALAGFLCHEPYIAETRPTFIRCQRILTATIKLTHYPRAGRAPAKPALTKGKRL